MARILVVEDSPDIRALMRMLLEAEGYDVAVAGDGQSGVAAARKERPDLILMDLSLPVLSGWEAAREIKADPEIAAIPILAVTAHAMHGDRERALAAGCDGFIPKPIDEETFGRQVAAHLRPNQLFAAIAEPRRSGDASVETGRILLVDDNPEVSAVIRQDLEAEGYEILEASTPAQAAAAFRREAPFDLAIVDVMLGGESGYELTAELIAHSSDYLPVLLVTAGEIDRKKGYQVGADDFIGKPIESEELRARVRSLLRIGRAIREQGRVVKERVEAYEKLAEVDRLKSDFLSTVSHELRTPLNTIILLSHLIEREGQTPADEKRRLHDVHVIRESAETLLRMINNILDLAKLEAGQRDLHPQKIVIREFLREIVDMLEPQARPKDLRISVEVDEALGETVTLDREKLSRVLINLVSNAVKYTARGRVALRTTRWQDSVAFEVQDTGAGVPPHLVATVFEPFRQIRPRTGEAPRGSGLGLTISKQLVELMGGDLLFDSREGVGTRVSFTLPELSEAEAAPAETRRPVPEAPPAEPLDKAWRVMIVEDDEASRYGLKSVLESEGYSVVEAASLAEAEQKSRQQHLDVAILDITLPDGDGAEWLELARKRGGEIPFPVIALTGVTADEDRRRIEHAGVYAVLYKPVNVNLLFDALKDCLQPT
jgi:CheY-like chemotaxis protein/nitrogen-specific signal transduction histidine kinase